MRISVVIPAFNEEGNIGRLIEETFAEVPDSALGEVIAVDDGSDDGTAAEIKALLGKYPALRYLRHGKGPDKAPRSGPAFGLPASRPSPPWMATGRTILPTSNDPGKASWCGRPRACHGRRHQSGPERARVTQSGLALCQLAA